jgi:tetrahydromethanopterin S-methyltransferase subunit A
VFELVEVQIHLMMPLMNTMVVDMVVECKEQEEDMVEEEEEVVFVKKTEEREEEEEEEFDPELRELPLVDLTIKRSGPSFVTNLATGLAVGSYIPINSPYIHNAYHDI